MDNLDIAAVGKPSNIIPLNDKERLAALFRYELLDTPPEPFFERITRMASRLLMAPSAFVSLVDEKRVWYKSNYSSLQVPCVDRADSLCSLTVINGMDVTVFEDTHEVPGLQDSIYVSAPGGIRFYAGAPLITHDNYNIGTICVIAPEPRSITDEDKEVLKDLAAMVVDQIELRALARRATRKHDELHVNLEHNIVAQLKAQSELLADMTKAPELAAQVGQAMATTNAMQENLQALLASTLQQEEEMRLHQKMVAISEIARAVTAEYQTLAEAKKQELYFTVASRRELFVDPDLIMEALSILVSTTIKYTPPGNAIGLDIYESEGLYKIEVSSDASELTRQDLQKIFFRYAMLSAHATGGENSSGLELPKAKRIIELHRGSIWAEHIGRESGNKFVIAFKVE
ncbi:GAF domain-containing sensor histidine kinase [Pontibacter sp. E15-1]|uniref:GAF domain-containing sensor histidine kinase n=1 Tax=Pontibacter sp. E15-1 TaxID=2919918 RepID=UPI001F4F888C|nr:GAF domain-containing sensor histidine kinase [Pontibacter sp. E15-1]MCJ8166275.1 GAF domain-containing sensor histidine kinase [Pontibacter sp. E15-1]